MKMLTRFLKEQRSYLNYFFDHLDLEKTEEIFQKLLACKGTIIFTGVGKSGIIAQKLAMTMLSTGTKSLYMPSTDGMHGDLGMVDEKDIFVMLSKSGKTEELTKLLPHVKNKGAFTIALVSEKNSLLFKGCDLSVVLPIPRELCPFDLAPTTSTEVQLIFGDLIAMMMMSKKNFSLKDFAKNHPAGSIGKKITMLVKDLMIEGEDIPLAYPSEKLIDLLAPLSEKKCGCLLVTDEEGKLQGIFTDGDLRRSIQKFGEHALHKKIAELMTKSARFTNKDSLAFTALQQMEENPKKLITVLPVLENEKIVGILRMHDILQSL